MKKIAIASKNPVKIKATLDGFNKMFPNEKFEIESFSVSSDVSDQPKGDLETFSGALNRVNNIYKKEKEFDFFIGIEGGIEEKNSSMESFAWIVIKSKNGNVSEGRKGTFLLPPKVAELIKEGKELGEASDIVFNKVNSKQDNGAVGILTNNKIDRTKFYSEAIILALIPFKNKELYNIE